jgi:hypothetical protein
MFEEKDELLEAYRATPVTLAVLVRDLPDDLLRRRGSRDEEWSIMEVICHLRDAEERSLGRVKRMREEDRPLLEGYDPAELARTSRYQEESLEAALAAFVDARRSHTELLGSGGDPVWSRTGIHEEFGEISVQQLTAHMTAHDAIHLAQISRRISSGR